MKEEWTSKDIDPIVLKNELMMHQWNELPYEKRKGERSVLFNKGRYFEMSEYYPEILEKVCLYTGLEPQFRNMLVGGKDKLYSLVSAYNKLGVYLDIKLDWV